jgi:membrane-bound inhibitor of C-type lysozyme
MRSALAVLLAATAAACASKPPTAAAPARSATTFECGAKATVTTRPDGEMLELDLEGKTHRLARVVAPSGAKYESTADKIVFWNTGSQATLTVDDQVYPTCWQVSPAAAR